MYGERSNMVGLYSDELPNVGGGRETYAWSKFYPYHSTDRTVDDMRESNVYLEADVEIPEDDLLEAIFELDKNENKIKLIKDLCSGGYKITARFIADYFEQEGEDCVLKEILYYCEDSLPGEVVAEMVSYGVDDDTFEYLMEHCEGEFGFDDIVEMLNCVDEISPELVKKLFTDAVGSPTYDQLEELLDVLDEEYYYLVKPYVMKLPFDQRVELRDMYELD